MTPRSGAIQGVGLGLRWELLDDVLEALEAPSSDNDASSALTAEQRELVRSIPFFEVSPENYMRRGGFFPAAIERVRAARPLLTHGLMMSLGGTDPFDASYMSHLRGFVDRLDPPFYSDHLCFCGVDGRALHDLLPIPFTRASARHVAARVVEARERLARPVAVENISHYLVAGRASLSEAEFIGDIVEGASCGLLLDVNNVYVNAQNYGFDPIAFLEALPLGRVVEIHIAGHERSEEDDIILDTHGAAMVDPMLDLLSWVIERTGPMPVLLERDNNVPPMADVLGELARARAAYERGVSAFRALRSERRASEGAA